MTILLPSLVTRALEALAGVMGASDLHEYLGEADAAALSRARRVLGELRETAIQVCDDPQHEVDQVRRSLERLVELKRARERVAGESGVEQTREEVVLWGRVEQIGTNRLDFGGGRVVRAPGPIQAVAEFGQVVAVLTEWIDDGFDHPMRRVRGNNLYGYGEDGGLLWRVQGPRRLERPLLLTGFLEDTPGLRLHEAYGWWVDVDPGTGRVTQAQWVG